MAIGCESAARTRLESTMTDLSTRHNANRARARLVIPLAGIGLALLGWSAVGFAPDPSQDPAAQTRPATAETSERPNVVIFLIDALRADRLGTYGYTRRPTSPRIDALANEAAVFEQASSPAPWTLPSVVSLVTSTFPCEHGMLDNRQRLSSTFDPLAARFQRLGYVTLGLYANALVGPTFGLDRGYTALHPTRAADGKQVGRLLDEHPNRPFFLYIHNIEPHTPFVHAPPHTDGFRDVSERARELIQAKYLRYRQATRVDFAEKRPLGTTDNSRRQQRLMAALTKQLAEYNELYDAAVRMADDRVGSVIDELKERDLWEDTLFIVLADHGEELTEHGGWLHDQSVYEELVHVPLIVRFPHGQYAGSRLKPAVSLVDVLPTLFDWLDAPELAQNARGRSLMPLLRGQQPTGDEELLVPAMRWNTKKYYRPWKESRGDVNVVVRRGQWKGIWNVEPKTLELYDLEHDPGEQRDLSGAFPDLAAEMLGFAAEFFNVCRDNAVVPTEQAEPDEETLQNLRALGYID
jgi:arylsulfatase A-like enzyme